MRLQSRLTLIFLVVAIISALPIFIVSNILLKDSLRLFINPELESLIDKSIIKTKGKEESIVRLGEEYKKLKFLEKTIERSIYIGSLLILLLVIIIAIVFGRIISKKITSPISNLLQATKELYLGNVDFEIKYRSKIFEIDRLTKAFNNMIKRIKKGREDLAKSQKELLETEKKAAWRVVAQKVAHEIKNPLTPIKLSMERILRKYKENDKDFPKILKEEGETILEEVEELYRLTHEFSEFAKFPSLEFKDYDINKILEEFIESFEKLYPEIEFHKEFSEDIPLVRLDKNSIKRVFSNLVKNSSEAMYEGGMVLFKTERDKDMVSIELVDNGCGIKEEDLEKIFEPHYSKKWGGVGLGLSIVKNIIEEHQGRIEVESKEGMGTRIKIFLPVKREEDEG
jgi:nitrogen fixation/metabolism regulation signal transduction histidine kinase